MLLWEGGAAPGDEFADLGSADPWDALVIAGKRAPGLVRIEGKGRAARMDRKNAPGADGATLTHNGSEPAEIDVTLVLWTQAHLDGLEALLRVLTPPKIPAPKAPKLRGIDLSEKFGRGFSGRRGNDDGTLQLDSPTLTTQSGLTIEQLGAALDQTYNNKVTHDHVLEAKRVAAANAPKPVDVVNPALALLGIRSLFVGEVGLLKPGSVRGTREMTIKFVELLKSSGTVQLTPKQSVALTSLQGESAVPTKKPSETNAGP